MELPETHASHPERSRCRSPSSLRMSCRYTSISWRRTSGCTDGGSTRFLALSSSKALERLHRNLPGRYSLSISLIALGLLRNLSTVSYLGWPDTLRRRETSEKIGRAS